MNSTINTQRPPSALTLAETFTWPAFLASSWTWCIGLYLPILLYERYGWAAVGAFIVPNLAGIVIYPTWFGSNAKAKAVAFKISQRRAMAWFSGVTLAFHGYFLGWFWHAELGVTPGMSVLIGLGILFVALATARVPIALLISIAVSVWIVSSILFIVTIIFGGPDDTLLMQSAALVTSLWPPASSSATWLWLVPIMAFGFLMCPVFDLTFHRAFIAVQGGRSGRNVFILFAILFALMLGFSCYYAARGFAWPALVHISLQAWITVALHAHEIIEVRRDSPRYLWMTLLILPVVCCAIAPRALLDYRHWYAFYGIVFPAWAILVAIPRLAGRRAAHPLTVWLTVLVSIPFGMIGFLTAHEWALVVPSVLTVLVALMCFRFNVKSSEVK